MANPNSVAIFVNDPGRTTGCAAGLIDLRQPTVASAMRRARSKGNLISWEVTGDHVDQAWEMARWIKDWYFRNHIERGVVAAGQFYVVSENFIPRQLNFDDVSLQIIGGFETLTRPWFEKHDVHYERQEPTMRWNTDQWLKDNRLWAPSDHERDARRHLAAKIDKLLS